MAAVKHVPVSLSSGGVGLLSVDSYLPLDTDTPTIDRDNDNGYLVENCGNTTYFLARPSGHCGKKVPIILDCVKIVLQYKFYTSPRS